MGELKCLICGASEDEVDNMIGIEYKYEDKKNDVALCDDCILEAHSILQDSILRVKIREEITKLQKEKNKDEQTN